MPKRGKPKGLKGYGLYVVKRGRDKQGSYIQIKIYIDPADEFMKKEREQIPDDK